MGTPGPEKVNRYGLEFKLRAVAKDTTSADRLRRRLRSNG